MFIAELVLSLLPAFLQPMTMAALCAVLLVLSGRILNGELRHIRLQAQHVYDYGVEGGKKAKPKNTPKFDSNGAVV